MEKQFSTTRQHDFFDPSRERWEKLPLHGREKIKSLLTQLLIAALRESPIVKKKENSHASEN